LYALGITRYKRQMLKLNPGDREPAEICPFVKSRIDAFVGDAPLFDDITMLALKFVGRG
jgi:serine phosphatase RsbU (regulator of sigma subunit)